MMELFLEERLSYGKDEENSAKLRKPLLNKLGSILWSLMTSGARSEARLWLCNSIAGMTSITPRNQRELFENLLRSKPQKWDLATQLLQMIFDRRPQKAGAIIARRGRVLQKFFEGNPRRISEWFSNFCTNGGSEHGKGAKALSQFAFVNRDICWEELEWKGKHGQSPAVVATKPHYFLDLDVQRTVENFLDNVPEFWSSHEFAESLKDGEILMADRKYFIECFLDLMYKENSRDVWDVIDEFLMEESFAYLCQHLLITLEESDFCTFLKMLRKFLNPRIDPKDFGNSSYMFEVIISKCSGSGSIDQILLLNAVINQRRQLLRLLRDEEALEEQAKVKDIVGQISAIPSSSNGLAPILQECHKGKTTEAVKCLGLQSWVLQYRMTMECQTADSWESLFTRNAITFRKSNEYALLEETGFDLECEASSKTKQGKKRKPRKRRKMDFDREDSYENELLEFDRTNDWPVSRSNASSWLLSTDHFNTTWNAVDLPEYLSKHCVSSWMKWVFAKWDEG